MPPRSSPIVHFLGTPDVSVPQSVKATSPITMAHSRQIAVWGRDEPLFLNEYAPGESFICKLPGQPQVP